MNNNAKPNLLVLGAFHMSSALDRHKSVYPTDWMERGVAIKAYREVYEWTEKNRPDLYSEILTDAYTPLDMNNSILQIYLVLWSLMRTEYSFLLALATNI